MRQRTPVPLIERSKTFEALEVPCFYETSTQMAAENRILLIQKNTMSNLVEIFQKNEINIFKYPASHSTVL